jgi:hypothetical protein
VPRERVAYLGNLKLLMVAAIIAVHGLIGYGDFEGAWPYQEVQEVQLTEASNIVLGMLLLPSLLFAMGLFFLISGLLTPGSLERKGPGAFAHDRLLRLGVPLALAALVIWPAMQSLAALAAGDGTSYLSEVVHADPVLDAGPMWFAEVLLIYSLAYAAWRRWRPRGGTPTEGAPLTGRRLLALAAAVSVATVLVRMVFPIEGGQADQAQLWQWPAYIAMFGLGVAAARHGWLDPVPEPTRSSCGKAALLGLIGVFVLMVTVAAAGLEPDVFFDLRLHWAPLTLAALEGPVAVGAGVWLLALAQHRLNRPPDRVGRALARGAYGAYFAQGAVLIGLAVALRNADLPAEVKALTVAGLGVVGSFALAWLVVTRTPVGRIM